MENGQTNRKLKPTKVLGGPGVLGKSFFFWGCQDVGWEFFFVGGKVKTILSFSVFFFCLFCEGQQKSKKILVIIVVSLVRLVCF